MNIIWGGENAKKIDPRFFVLELDTLHHKDESIACYVVLGPGDIPLNSWPQIEDHKKVHENLIENVKEQKWDYCTKIIPSIRGKFGKDVDEFYDMLLNKCS